MSTLNATCSSWKQQLRTAAVEGTCSLNTDCSASNNRRPYIPRTKTKKKKKKLDYYIALKYNQREREMGETYRVPGGDEEMVETGSESNPGNGVTDRVAQRQREAILHCCRTLRIAIAGPPRRQLSPAFSLISNFQTTKYPPLNPITKTIQLKS